MKIIILGPPGSGKGTRAHIISELFELPVITTGDMLRGAVREKTEYGLEAKTYMDKGDLVPDDIVNGIVKERMSRPDVVKGFILDGYPRSVNQAEALDEILNGKGMKLTHVLSVVLSDEEIIERLSKRRNCPECNEIYHLVSKPPKKEGACDKCGAKLILREDDKEDVINVTGSWIGGRNGVNIYTYHGDDDVWLFMSARERASVFYLRVRRTEE